MSFFRTSNIHTPFRLFICVKLIISVHGCFTVATVRHKPSPIVAVRANLATRLGSSRSVNFAPTWRPVSDRHDPSTFSGGLPRGFLMSLCRSFANPDVAYSVRDKCRCRFFAVIKMSLLHKICAMQSVISIIYYCSCS